MALDLPKSTLTGLNQAYKKVLDAQANLDKLERAGNDVSAVRAELNVWQDKIEAHKREFFPNDK